jgi:UDP-glucuronate decarboxylase
MTYLFLSFQLFEVLTMLIRLGSVPVMTKANNDGRVISNFIVQALQNKPLTIYGDGKQTRSFCYVDDLIDALVRLMGTGDDVIGPVNCGNPVECTILELAQSVISLTNSKSKIQFHPLPHDDPKQRQPDIKLAQQLLGWKPSVTLEDGLKKTISYFEQMIRSNKA